MEPSPAVHSEIYIPIDGEVAIAVRAKNVPSDADSYRN